MTSLGAEPPPRALGRGEIVADAVVHAVGLAAAVVGVVVLLAISADGTTPLFLASAIYATGLVVMLGCSAAYNVFAHGAWKDFFRRLDQAGIFLMIAGTYTPFTTQHLAGAWSVAMTSVVWTVAIAGIVIKLAFPRRLEGVSVGIYLALGWIALVALKPLVNSLGTPALVLLCAGGVLYTAGIVFHLWERLPFQNAIWHAFVVAAAGVHYAAVLGGVVLA